MKTFEVFLKTKKIKKVSPNLDLAVSLRDEAVHRSEQLMSLDKLKFGKIIFEGLYDSIRELIDAFLALEGYKSYSHEVSVSYLLKLNFSVDLVLEFDRFRQLRNDSKYRGRRIEQDDVEKILTFHALVFFELCSLIKSRFELL
jgi:hypothetical protein